MGITTLIRSSVNSPFLNGSDKVLGHHSAALNHQDSDCKGSDLYLALRIVVDYVHSKTILLNTTIE